MPFASEAQAAGYLAGMVDGEGTVTVPGKTHRLRRVSIANTDMGLLEACGEACDVLGIEWSIYARKRPERWSPAWDLVIYGQHNILKVCELPICSAFKRAKLNQLVDSWQYARRARKRWPLDEVRGLYAEGMSYQEVADHFHIAISTAYKWAKAAGVESRSDSESMQLAWARGRRVRAV